ncbi:hypothetical protein D3C73_696200 [compost metagenome]
MLAVDRNRHHIGNQPLIGNAFDFDILSRSQLWAGQLIQIVLKPACRPIGILIEHLDEVMHLINT